MKTLTIKTKSRCEMVNITSLVDTYVKESQITDGICVLFVPHTTAAVTINENADPDVVTDMLEGLDKMVPKLKYRHYEGNTIAHIKASLMGASINIPIDNGVLCLGQWQGIYFCEFDGPRTRSVYVNIIS